MAKKKKNLQATEFEVPATVKGGHYPCRYPYYDALEAISRGQRAPLPTFLRKSDIYSLADLTDAEVDELQSWCVCNANPGWSTGIGMMEAAEILVIEAVANGNIAAKEGHSSAEKETHSPQRAEPETGIVAVTDAIEQVLKSTRRRIISWPGRQDAPL